MSEVEVSRSLPLRLLILIILWSLFVLWMAMSATGAMSGIGGTAESGYRVSANYTTALLALDLWALLAALIVGLIGFNPFHWLNSKRLIIGSMAFAMMLGRLISGLPILLLQWLPLQLTQGLIAIIVPFMLLLAGAMVIIIIAVTLMALFGFLVGIPVMLFNQILAFDNAVHVYRFQAQGLAAYIIRAIYWLRSEPMPAAAPDDKKGARFATQAEAAVLHNATKGNAARMGFGHWTGKTDTPFFVATDKHILVMASTRSGKGVALIIPHLLRYQGSAFVLDPKGENARATGRQRARLNNQVHYLDPFGISGKPQSRFNPLSRFTPETMEADAKALAAAMFVVEPRERSHWTDSGQQLLAAVILYIYVSPEIPAALKDLVTVRKILLATLPKALDEMTKLDAGGGLLRDLAFSFMRTPEKEFGSILSTTLRQTEILDNPYMQACLAAAGDAPEVDFEAWHRGTMTVYLCLAAPKFPTFNRWLRLLLTSALDTMTERLNPPKLPVCFMLDELATLGRLATVENAVGLSAGYGIQLVMVFQDVAQMSAIYEKRWASFVGNAGVRAVFNLDDFESADYWSKFIGGQLVETYGRQEDMYGLSKGRSVSETVRPLLPPERLMTEFASGHMLVLVQGTRPIVTDRVGYFHDSTLAGLFDDPRAPIAPKQAATGAPGSGPSTGPGGPSKPNGSGPRPNPPAGGPAAGTNGHANPGAESPPPNGGASRPSTAAGTTYGYSMSDYRKAAAASRQQQPGADGRAGSVPPVSGQPRAASWTIRTDNPPDPAS